MSREPAGLVGHYEFMNSKNTPEPRRDGDGKPAKETLSREPKRDEEQLKELRDDLETEAPDEGTIRSSPLGRDN